MADLITRAEYKAYAGLTTPNQDAQIDSIIPGVSQFIENYCKRKFQAFVVDPYVETFSGQYYPIVLTHFPLLNIVSVEESTDFGATYASMDEYTTWILDREENVIRSSFGSFNAGVNRYRISYTYGFEILPDDLRLAIFDLVKYYMRNDMAVHSNKAPGTNTVQLEYQAINSIPAHIRRVLDLYRVDYA